MSDRHKKEHKKGHKKDHKKDERKDHKSHDHVMEASGVDSIVVTNPIDMSCFYMKNDEFRVWLKLEKSKAFEDLSTPISHEYFEKFIKYYNRGSLPQMYYTTIPSEIKDSCKKSTHKWGFRVSESEKDQLASTQDEVSSWTNSVKETAWNHHRKGLSASNTVGSLSTKINMIADRNPLEASDDRDQQEAMRKLHRMKAREAREEVIEEFAPHDREKKKSKDMGYKQYVTSHKRDTTNDDNDENETMMMGGGSDDKWRAMELHKIQFNRTLKAERIRELADKDKQRSEACMRSLGIDISRGPITIASRDDVHN